MSGQDLEEAKRDKKFDEELAEIIKEIAGSDESASEEMTEDWFSERLKFDRRR